MVRERGEERETGAARVGRDKVANTIVREMRIPESLVREVEVDSFVTLAAGLLRQREVIRLKREIGQGRGRRKGRGREIG